MTRQGKVSPSESVTRITVPEPWWAKRPGKAVWPRLTTLVHEQYTVQAQRYLTFRKNTAVREYGYRAAEKVVARDRWLDETVVAFNRAQNATDTLVSTVSAAKILPMFASDGGDWFERQDAEQATRGLAGLFAEHRIDELSEDLMYDAVDTGAWFVKVYADPESGTLCIERADPLDILFDDAETRYRRPRCMYHRIFMDRYVAAARFGIVSDDLVGSAAFRKDRILHAPYPTGTEIAEPTADECLVEVIEAWHLPSGYLEEEDEDDEGKPRKTDGMHAIVVQGADIVVEAYTKKDFPFVIGIPRKARQGIWGIPMMRQLIAAQRESEILDAKLQRAHKRIGGTHIMNPRTSNVAKRQMTNDVGDIWDYDPPAEPHVFSPDPANPQTYQYLEQIGQNMLRFCGVPQMSAQGEVPRGMDSPSGKALQTFIDEGAKYLNPWFRAREYTVKRIADLTLDAIAELVESDKDYATSYEDMNGGFEKIQWKSICENRKKLVIKVDPVNALSMSMSGKLNTVGVWFDQKIIDANEYRRMSEIPDLRASTAMAMASDTLIEKKLTLILRKGTDLYPEPFDDHELTIIVGQKFYNARIVDGVSPEHKNMGKVRQYLTDTQAEIDKQKAAAGPGPGAPPEAGGAPPSEGMPPEGMGAPPPEAMGAAPPPPEMMAPPAAA